MSIDRLSIPVEDYYCAWKIIMPLGEEGGVFRFFFPFWLSSLSFFSLFGMFRFHANKAKKHTFFRFKARTKIPTFSLIFALSEYERRTLLLTVETEMNGNSKSTTEGGPSLVDSWGSSCRYKRFLCCLGCSSRPSTNFFQFSRACGIPQIIFVFHKC